MREEVLTHLANYVAHVRAVPTCNQPSIARNKIHEATKREFHCVQIIVNVCMIELDIVDDGKFGQVVHELRPLIEICRVVFIAFDDEVLAVSNPKARAEILRHATNQKSRIQAAPIHHRGRNAGGGCFAMRAGNYERATTANEFLFEHFGKGAIRKFASEHLFDFRVAARNRVANNNEVGRRVQVLRLITLHDGNSQALKHRRHRRIDILVRSGDTMSA